VGVVKNIMPFGIFVEIWPGTDGLVRNGDLSNEYIERPEDVFSEGDTMIVRCTGVDNRGRISLSRKHALEEAASL
jgi:polyribonucleotide nucleotidyltransferase